MKLENNFVGSDKLSFSKENTDITRESRSKTKPDKIYGIVNIKK